MDEGWSYSFIIYKARLAISMLRLKDIRLPLSNWISLVKSSSKGFRTLHSVFLYVRAMADFKNSTLQFYVPQVT